MPRMSRTLMVSLLGSLTLALILGSWFRSGWQSSKREAAALRSAPAQRAQLRLGELAMELTTLLDGLRTREDARPYYHYQNLFHDPRSVSLGKSVSPSPLVDATGDPMIEAHFQIDAKGQLSIPPVNEEFPQFSRQASVAEDRKELERLRSAQAAFMDTPALLASSDPELTQDDASEPTASSAQDTLLAQGTPRDPAIAWPNEYQQAPVQQARFPEGAYMQNSAPNMVIRELDQKTNLDPSERESEREPSVEVSTHGFLWRAVQIEGRDELVAMRAIETPAGTLSQGFLVGFDRLAEWLDSREPEGMQVSLHYRPSPTSGDLSIELPSLAHWYLVSGAPAARARAESQARALVTAFLWRFFPLAFVALLLLIAVVVVVARSERLAQERSAFAAAAAHELRTPLAGLQLYGDMLAEGLGDTSAKERYARLISDEAQRLGRVVSNVLDFSQMEKTGITMHARRSNLAKSVGDICERMRGPLESAGMLIELQLPDELDAIYDDDALSRIVQNLVDNAEKYTRDHPDRRMHIKVDEQGGYARVSVSDAGPGVSRAARSHIFKSFRRSSGDDAPAGLGLGLALARALARKQGGDLSVHDSSLGGACFVLTLPSAKS